VGRSLKTQSTSECTARWQGKEACYRRAGGLRRCWRTKGKTAQLAQALRPIYRRVTCPLESYSDNHQGGRRIRALNSATNSGSSACVNSTSRIRAPSRMSMQPD
jgi:hypothetical protein